MDSIVAEITTSKPRGMSLVNTGLSPETYLRNLERMKQVGFFSNDFELQGKEEPGAILLKDNARANISGRPCLEPSTTC